MMSLKQYYNTDFAKFLAERIATQYPEFDVRGFVRVVSAELTGKEYSQRMVIFANALNQYLPSYASALKIFTKILGPKLKSFAVMYDDGAWLAPIGKYVEVYCADYPEHIAESVLFIHKLTQRYTGEFAMRPLIQQFPEHIMPILLEWTKSDCPYVRRCASECMRVRLPWAKKLTAAIERFDDYVAILDNLRNDENPYVQRSVGNNLNDLFKYDPAQAEYIINRWQSQPLSIPTKNIIRHGTRTIRKQKK